MSDGLAALATSAGAIRRLIAGGAEGGAGKVISVTETERILRDWLMRHERLKG